MIFVEYPKFPGYVDFLIYVESLVDFNLFFRIIIIVKIYFLDGVRFLNTI